MTYQIDDKKNKKKQTNPQNQMRHMPSAAQEWQWGFPFPQAIAQFLAHPYNSSCLRQKKLESQMLAQ